MAISTSAIDTAAIDAAAIDTPAIDTPAISTAGLRSPSSAAARRAPAGTFHQRHPRLAMWAAAAIVAAVFVLSNAPTPLYMRWQAELGFSSSTLAALFSIYVVGLLITLPIAGQCSDQLGCRRVLIPGIAAGMLACLLFATARSVALLLLARFVSGISVAAAIGAGLSWVVELGGALRRRNAAQLASVALVLGASLGPLLGGWFALTRDESTRAVFWTELALLAGAGALAMTLPPGRTPRLPGASGAWRLRFPSVCRDSRLHVALGASLFGCAMSCTAFVLSLGPSVLARSTGVDSPLVAGGMACAMFMTATLAQVPAGKLTVRRIFALSALSIVVAMACLVTAVAAASPAALLSGAILAGAAHGLAQLAGLTLIAVHVSEGQRAQATALLNIGGYIPCGLMPVMVGVLVDHGGFTVAITGFALCITLATTAAWLFVSSYFR